ncbi:MAG: glycosyltransferase family 2 protein [Gemmatimonadetes bacterium]|jgi:glycosyltransferase involved in cell wall biosynthesis|nr:glycosyltransferase family 2 protein [Gemmatimonadota bacterium]
MITEQERWERVAVPLEVPFAESGSLLASPAGPAAVAGGGGEVELSIVMPCLNEAETLGTCIAKAQRAFADHAIAGEIVVADNGSSDGSPEIARRLGARVVHVAAKGYGSALMGGIAAARGRYVIMGDADDSYDFLEIPRFLERLREGYDLVQGCRLESGGGRVMPGAMPFLHRWWGNPMFSALARGWFGAPIHDVYCGMRGFSKALYEGLHLRSTGMEFATEMIIRASLTRSRIAEVPITLHPDGRTAHPPHLKTFRDGWRTLRFFLLYSPRWLFMMPGLALILFGIVGYAVAMPALTVRGINFDVHTMLVASLAIIAGYQSLAFAVSTKLYAVSHGLLPDDDRLSRLLEYVHLERGLVAGVVLVLAGLVLLGVAVNQWRLADFGSLDYAVTMRWVIPGVTLTMLGVQTVLTSFFLAIFGTRPSA